MFESGEQFCAGGFRCGMTNDNDERTACEHGAATAKKVAQTAFDEIAADRATIDFARHGKPKASRPIVNEIVQSQQRRRDASSLFEDASEFGFGAYPRLRRERSADLAGRGAAGHRPGGSASGIKR
jgi:hypothetical protein